MADSIVDRIKKLDLERSTLLSDAKKEALALVQQGLDGLRALGLSFNLVEGERRGKRAKPGKRSGAGKGAIQDAPCPICGFKTEPPHDARKHRGQGKRKRAFTAKQLQELGLKKV
jgi:hypothetical protein